MSDSRPRILFGENDEQLVGEIARRKKFEHTLMDEIEALEQMRMLGHEDFSIFS